MDRLEGKDIVLAALSREDCRTLWRETEYDFEHPTEPPYLGLSEEGADGWFEEIQRLHGSHNVRLGIYLRDSGRVIGDIALQDIDRANRNCTVGMGIARMADRGRGYGKQALALLLDYGFRYLGLERIAANTLDINDAAKKSLEDSGFTLEGCERRAVWFCGAYHDRLRYAILREEFEQSIA